MDYEDEWFRLRLDFLRERVAGKGAEADYVALVQQLLAGYKTSGYAEYLTEAAAGLEQARLRYPNSIPVWEHTALFDSFYGTSEDLTRSLGVLARLDPGSPAVRAVDRLTDDDVAAWRQQGSETALRLLGHAGSADAAVSAAAIAGLEEWARSYPRNSTYAVNLSLGLLSARRTEEAHRAALSAAQIEDGSFVDAYNIGIVFAGTGDFARAQRFLGEALARASSPEEMALVQEEIGRLPE